MSVKLKILAGRRKTTNYPTVKTSPSIAIVTGIILAMAAAFIVGGIHDRNLLSAGALLGIIAFVCYLLAPASYDVTDGCLTVVLHAGKRSFGQIIGCARITERPPFTIRLFGNGGLFAGTGVFWNKRYGIFRVYVTSARLQDAILVQTKKHKVLITPEDPQAFMESTQAQPDAEAAAFRACADSETHRRVPARQVSDDVVTDGGSASVAVNRDGRSTI
jgi:hypothetical protein